MNNSWNTAAFPPVAIASKEETSMSGKNIVAAIVIIAVIVGGGLALYKVDDGRGDRTSQDISAKTASD
jgi:hypothetical protein